MKHSLHSTFTPERRMMYYLFLLGFFAIFSTTISKNPVLPLFSNAIGADSTVIGLIRRILPARRDPVLVSRRGQSRTISGENASSSLHGAVFLIAPSPLPLHHRAGLADPGPVLPRDGNRDPRAGHLRSDRRTVPGHERRDARAVLVGNSSSAGPLHRSPAGSSSRILSCTRGFIPYRMVYITAGPCRLCRSLL